MSPNKPLAVGRALLTLLLFSSTGISQTDGITAQAIVENMAAQYSHASSYQDTGVVEDARGEGLGQRETVIQFKTFFTRPHFLRFEWTDRSVVASEERLNVVWNDGKQTYRYYSWDEPAVAREASLGLGLAGATGISRGSAHIVPSLLMAAVGGFRLTEMTNLALLGEENFEGVDCYIVRGYHPHNFPIELWVGKQDFLLRKTKGAHDDGTYQVEIRRAVKLNAQLPPALFNYTPPAHKPRTRRKLAVGH